MNGTPVSLALCSLLATSACGVTLMRVHPANVAKVWVKPSSGRSTFCPGEDFQVEVVAQLQDGSTCSSTNRKMGCLGKKDAIMDPEEVRVEASAGRLVGERREWSLQPDSNVLATAAEGLLLRGWLERTIEDRRFRSPVGEMRLRPSYDCQQDKTFTYPSDLDPTHSGVRGPNLVVAATPLRTPFHPDAMLIRVEKDGEHFHVISPSEGDPVRIFSKGQAGARGDPGVDGQDVTD